MHHCSLTPVTPTPAHHIRHKFCRQFFCFIAGTTQQIYTVAESIFPELYTPGKNAILVSIDPDINGAIAGLHWTNNDLASSSKALPSFSQLCIHDMPTEIWKSGTRNKRQPDALQLAPLFEEYSRLRNDGTIIRAVVEYSMPHHTSGKYAWYGLGFAIGQLNGLLVSAEVPYKRVHAASWKRGLGLIKRGKEGSLGLAKILLPESAKQLTRKKDHGRAEALLIAMWSLGVRVDALSHQPAEEEVCSEEDEICDQGGGAGHDDDDDAIAEMLTQQIIK